jgi:hypothetical protein
MLAAVTFWYEIYYDVWLSGQYFKQIAKMHEKYGRGSNPRMETQTLS